MIIRIYYVYSLVHAGEVSVGVVVGFILPIAIIAAASVIVILLVVIALRQKAKQCGTVDIKPIVSVDKYSMRILVYFTVILFCMALVYFNSRDLIAVLNWYNFVGKMDDWLLYSSNNWQKFIMTV